MATKLEDLASHREARQGRDAAKVTKSRARRGCPICGAAAVDRFRPFCSRRCADIDLGRWLDERYRIPAEDEGPESEKSDTD